MRTWRTTGHENGFQEANRGGGSASVLQAFVVSDCLKVGLTLCDDKDPATETDLRRSNRLPWRGYANSSGTWLWIGCTSGNGCGLLIDRSQGWKGAKAAP